MKILVLTLFLLLTVNNIFSQIENCLKLDGINDYVYIGNVNNFGTNDFTIEAWVNFRQDFGPNGYKIISKGNTTVGFPSNAGYSLRGFCTGLNTDLDFSIGHSDGSVARITYNGLNTNTWYHVAGVRKGRAISLYVNGILVATETYSFVYNVDTNIPLSIGAINKNNLSPTNEFMDGKIDEVRFWSVARSQTQILDNKDCAITSPELNLLTVYNFDQNSTTQVVDASGNNKHGYFVSNVSRVSSTVALQCAGFIDEVTNLVNSFYNINNAVVISLNEEVIDGSYKVFDLNGKLVKTGQIVTSDLITINNLSKAMYIIEVKDVNNELIGKTKFVKF